jgi:dTDP-4-amino-4,6-dideoxygalactose transaminase
VDESRLGDSETVPFALPDITEREVAEVVDTLRSNWITSGPKVRRFEAEFAAAVESPHAVAVNSCTAAMHLALEAIGVEQGDRVYLSPYTFAATAEVVRYLGAVPVFVDIEADSLNIDLDKLAARLEEDRIMYPGKCRAVMPVHIAGLPVDMEKVWNIAREYDIAVVEDAAHAFPSRRRDSPIGFMPEDVRGAVCFSFYATKTITTGEGGMLVTPHVELAERARSMCLHGLSRAAWSRYEAGGSWRYDIVAPGFKYNLTDIAASMGLVQLARSEEMASRRRAIAERYHGEFGSYAVLDLPVDRQDVGHAWHLYVLRVDDELARDSLAAHLAAHGVGFSVHFIPLHLHSYYRDTYGYQPHDFPVATREFGRAVSLPIFSSMSDAQVDRVVEVVSAWAETQPGKV